MVTEIDLRRFESSKGFRKRVDAIKQQKGLTFTAHAIKQAIRVLKTSRRYKKKTNKKFVIVVTDGRSTDYAYLRFSATDLHELGIIPFVIGVKGARRREMLMITRGDKERIYFRPKYFQLLGMISDLKKKILVEVGKDD